MLEHRRSNLRRAFEVASVKQNKSGASRGAESPGLSPTVLGEFIPRAGQVRLGNIALRDIIAKAYQINPGIAKTGL